MNVNATSGGPARGSTAPAATSGASPWAGRRIWFVGIGGVAAVVLGLLVAFGGFDNTTVGLLSLLLILLLLALSVPIGVAMILVSVIGLWSLGGTRVIGATLEGSIFSATASWQLSVIPLFVLMGGLLGSSGLTSRVFQATRQLLGWMPGGLAVATNFAGAGLAASSGSTVGIAYALGRVGIPEMMRSGYRASIATSTVAAAGALGQIIPPSIMLVIYAGIVQTPVGPTLVAGVLPGLVLALGFAVMIVARAAANPAIAPRDQTRYSWPGRVRALVSSIPLIIVVVVVVGGLFFGVFTATEASAVGVLAALVLGVLTHWRDHRNWRATLTMLATVLRQSVLASASIFLLIIGVKVLARLLALSRVANEIADFVAGLGLTRVEFLLALIAVYLALGMFMDSLAMILLTVPLLMVPLQNLDVDLIWFGVFVVMMAEVGTLTPPIGLLTYIVHRMAQDPQVNAGHEVGLVEVFRGVTWFVIVSLLVAVLMIFVPELVTWLPARSAT